MSLQSLLNHVHPWGNPLWEGPVLQSVTKFTDGLYHGGRSETTLEQCLEVLRSGGLPEFPALAWDCFHCRVLCVSLLQPHNLLLQVVSNKEENLHINTLCSLQP